MADLLGVSEAFLDTCAPDSAAHSLEDESGPLSTGLAGPAAGTELALEDVSAAINAMAPMPVIKLGDGALQLTITRYAGANGNGAAGAAPQTPEVSEGNLKGEVVEALDTLCRSDVPTDEQKELVARVWGRLSRRPPLSSKPQRGVHKPQPQRKVQLHDLRVLYRALVSTPEPLAQQMQLLNTYDTAGETGASLPQVAGPAVQAPAAQPVTAQLGGQHPVPAAQQATAMEVDHASFAGFASAPAPEAAQLPVQLPVPAADLVPAQVAVEPAIAMAQAALGDLVAPGGDDQPQLAPNGTIRAVVDLRQRPHRSVDVDIVAGDDVLANWPNDILLERTMKVGSSEFHLRIIPGEGPNGGWGVGIYLQQPKESAVEVTLQVTVGEMVRRMTGRLGVKADGSALERCDAACGWLGENAFSLQELKSGAQGESGLIRINVGVGVEAIAGVRTAQFEVVQDTSLSAPREAAPPVGGLARDMGKVLATGLGANTIIIASGHKFRVHAAVVMARSPKLKEMLSGAGVGAQIDLGHIDPEAFSVVLRHLYTEGLPPDDCSPELAGRLLTTSEALDVPSLQLWCERKLHALLTPETAISTLILAEERGGMALKSAALGYAASNYETVTQSSSWLHLIQVSAELATEVLKVIAVGGKQQYDAYKEGLQRR